MKTKISLFFLLFLSIYGFSQKTPDYFLNRVPSLPNTPCACSTNEKEAFVKKVNDLADEINADKDKNSDQIKQFSQQNQDQILANIMATQANPANMSPDDIQKMIQETQELQKFQTEYMQKITEIAKRWESINTEYLKEKAQRIDPIDKKIRELPDGEGATAASAAERKKLEQEKEKILQELCAKYTPKISSVLTDKMTALKTTGLPYMKVIDGMIVRMGLSKTPVYVSQNGAIAEQIRELKEVFMFRVNK